MVTHVSDLNCAPNQGSWQVGRVLLGSSRTGDQGSTLVRSSDHAAECGTCDYGPVYCQVQVPWSPWYLKAEGIHLV